MKDSKSYRALKMLLPIAMIISSILACDMEADPIELSVGDAPQRFHVNGGWDYTWYADVTPGQLYEVSVMSLEPDTETPSYISLSTTNWEACRGRRCILSAGGYITESGLLIIFIAPESGRARIQVSVMDGSVECEIQIREAAQ